VDIVYSTDSFSSQAVIATGVLNSAGTYSWDTMSFPESGAYLVRFLSNPGALIYDTSNAIFMVDNTAPVTTETPAPASPNGDNGWYISAPTITLTCDDGTGSGCLSSGTYYDWNDITPTTVYTAPITAPEGENTLSYFSEDEAVDNVGAHNQEGVTSTIYKVDTTFPTVVVTSTTANGYYNQPDTINVTLTFSEPVSSTDTLTVTLNSGGSCSVPILTNTTTGTCTYTVGAGENSSDLTVASIIPDSGVVEDIAGNDSALSPTSNIADTSDIVVDTTFPIAFTTGSVTTSGGTVVSGWWNSTNTGVDVLVPIDNDASLEGGTVQLQVEADSTYEDVGSPTTILGGFLGNTPSLSLTEAELEAIAGFSEGDNLQFRAVITDIAGNATTGTQSATSLDVDQTLPSVDADSDKEVNTATLQNATVTDTGGSGISTYLWAKDSGSGTITFTPDATSEDTTISASADDTYGISLTVVDIAGNSNSNDIIFVWDTIAPVLAVVTPIPSPTNDTTPSYTFSADHVGWLTATGPVSYAGTCGSGDLSAASAGNNTTTFSALGNAIYTDCDLAVTDAAGNLSLTLEVNDFEIDTIAATVSTITTYDTDFNGKVDKVTIVFDDPVDDSTFTPSDFSIDGVLADGFDTETTVDNETVSLTFSTQVPGTGAKSLVYGSTALDLAGNSIATFTTAATDEAKPVLLSAKTVTTTSIEATFSEDLDGATLNTVALDEFTVAGGTYTVVGASELGGVITLTVTTMPTDATPDVTYTQVDMLNDLATIPNTAVTPTTVTAVDEVAPVLTSVSIVSNNIKDTSLAKVGDTVTLSFTASEDTATPVVTIDGMTATVSGGPTAWTATYVFVGAEAEGTIPFTIDFEDTVSPPNVGTTVTSTTDASSVFFDEKDPIVDAGVDREVNAPVTPQGASASDATPDASGVDTYTWTQESGPGTVTFSNPSGTGTGVDTDLAADTDGTYILRLTVEDEAGNVAFDELTFIWDTTNPVQEALIAPEPQTGVLITAGTAKVRFDEPVVLLDASRVLLKNNAGTSYKGTVAVDGGDSTILNIAYTGLAYGTVYDVIVKPNSVSDVAGNNVSTNFTAQFTTEIDTVVPVVNSFNVSGITTTGATLNVTTDEDATCRYATTDSAYASMTTPFTTTGGTAHTEILTGLSSSAGYDYFVRCADTTTQTNTMTTSAHASFTTADPDTVAPPAPVISGSNETVDADTYTLSGTAGADTPTDGTRTVTIYRNGTVIDSLDIPTGQTAWSFLVPLAQNTTNTFTAYSTDKAGYTSATSNSRVITEADAVDTTAPDVPVITTSPATIDADTYTIAGTVADDGGTRVVSLYNGATLAGTASIPTGDTAWSILVPLTQDASNVFTATADDEAGNTSAASASVTITEATVVGDTDAPAIPVISGTDETVDADTYTLSGTAGADTPSDGPRTITIYRNSVTTVVGSIVLPMGETAWSFVAPLLQDVTNTFTAYSTDEAGNTSAVSNSIVITEATVADTTAPDVPVITTGATTVDADTYTIAGTVADDGGTRVVSLYNGATLVGTASVPTGDTAWSISAVPLTQDAGNVFTATADDEAGNTSSASAPVTITEASSADTTVPPIPVITTSPATIDAGTYTIVGTAGADIPSDTDRTITISRNGTVVGSLVLLSGETAWSFVATLLQDTANVFTAVSTDAAGNSSSASSSVTITEAEGTASLAVTAINMVANANGSVGYAIDNDEFDDGWRWTFKVTVPTSETEFSMKFADFTSGGDTILAADNIRFYSAQASASSASITAETIIAANTYAGPIILDDDIDPSTAGRQIEVTVEMKVPVGSAGGSYSAQYGVKSETI